MKLNNFILSYHIKLLVFTVLIALSFQISSNNSESSNLKIKDSSKNVFQMKVLVINQQLKNNPMAEFDYKFLTLTKLEAVFYESKISKLPTEENETCTKNYLFTQLYYQIQLPCMGKSVVCKYGDILREYKAEYPQINWDLPKPILQSLGEEKAKTQCLVVTYDSFDKVSDNIFICHMNPEVVNEIQTKLSDLVREVYQKNTELFMEHLPNLDVRGRVSGLLRLDQDSLKFIGLENKKVIFEMPYLKIEPFPFNYYKKEPFPIKDEEKAYDKRCIKISVKDNATEFKVVCVFYSPGDFTKKEELVDFRSRWLAEFYTHKINQRVLPAIQQDSLEKLANIGDSLEVESNLLTPVIFNFRDKFLAKANEVRARYKAEKSKDPMKLADELKKVKEETIKTSCNEVVICMRALNYKIENGLLPLGDKNTKFSFSMDNPYMSLYPNRNIKVDNINDGLGKSLVQEVSRLKGTENYFAEELKLAPGGVPDFKDIIGALQVFKNLRKPGLKTVNLAKFKSCSNKDGIGYQIDRKLALLPLMTDKDFLFNFLGDVGNAINSSH